jgi:UDP-N-acetyl-D-galactosamine dehydrogenase
MTINFNNELQKKLNSFNLKIAVVGLGYVGLPLALLFGKKFPTIGIDSSSEKINKLLKFIDLNNQCKKKDFLDAKKIKFSTSYKKISLCDIVIVCLPTPVNKKNKPDLSILKYASKKIGKNIKKNTTIIYESTVFPGTVEEICSSIIEKNSKLAWKKDFFLGYSPERVNPNDSTHTIENISKIVASDNIKLTSILAKLYKTIIVKKVIKVNNIKIAETAKVIENTQRDINIALMNELSIICQKLGINTKEVIEAAGTKWNFIKFFPGLVGGHCIGVDPFYLKSKSIELGYYPKIISSGRKLNDSMTGYLAKIIEKSFKKSDKILFIGLTFKENCNDIRNSKNIELVQTIKLKKKFNIDVFDPLITKKDLLSIKDITINFKNIRNLSNEYDGIVLLVPHNTILDKIDFYLNKIKDDGFFFDIKSMVKNSVKKKYNIKSWSL